MHRLITVVIAVTALGAGVVAGRALLRLASSLLPSCATPAPRHHAERVRERARAAEEAARVLPPGVQLVLCASSPDTPELLARLEAAVAGRPEIRWINAMLPVPEVVQLYSHAAVFVCPSIYEPFGLINLEAMACGTPVVASRVGGIPEVVVDGETGWLVEPGDATALGRALREALADPERARRMGEAGRRRVEAQFAWDRIADRTLAVYRDAIEDHGRAPAK